MGYCSSNVSPRWSRTSLFFWGLLFLQYTCILCVCSCSSFGFCSCIPSVSVAVGALHRIVSCRLALPLIPACYVLLFLRYCPASPALLCLTLVPCILPLMSLLVSCRRLSFGPCILCVPWAHPVCYLLVLCPHGCVREPQPGGCLATQHSHLQCLWWRPGGSLDPETLTPPICVRSHCSCTFQDPYLGTPV